MARVQPKVQLHKMHHDSYLSTILYLSTISPLLGNNRISLQSQTTHTTVPAYRTEVLAPSLRNVIKYIHKAMEIVVVFFFKEDK